MHRVKINKHRPDFRVFIDLLYGNDRSVDTEGDSVPVNSRTWTYLYISDRESGDPSIELGASEHAPEVFEVVSESSQLEELTALYLYLSCGSSIASGERVLTETEVGRLRNVYASQLQRADKSIWHRSSNETPYPNLST